MGYTTKFKGEIALKPSLSMEQYAALCALHDSQKPLEEATAKKPPSGYCQWEPGKDGQTLAWDGGEKFYNYVEWMDYLCAVLAVWKIKANGEITWQGEERGDRGIIRVVNNVATARKEDLVAKGKNKAETLANALKKIAATKASDFNHDADAALDYTTEVANKALEVAEKQK